METRKEIKKRLFLALLFSLAFIINLGHIKLLKMGVLFGLFFAVTLFLTYVLPRALETKKMNFKKQIISVIACLLILTSTRIAFENTAEKIEKFSTCSMAHAQQDFDEWWQWNSYKYNTISKEEFKAFPFPNGIQQEARDTINVDQEQIERGEVIVYKNLRYNGTAHRVLRKYYQNNTLFFETLGDNNKENESVPAKNIIGKYVPGNRIQTIGMKLAYFLFYDPCNWKVQLETPGPDEQFCFEKRRAFCTKEQNECCNVSANKKPSCAQDYAEANNDAKNCCLIDELWLFRSLCYNRFALQQKDETLCSFMRVYFPSGTNCWKINSKKCIKVFDRKDDCYYSIATEKKELQICKKIYDATKRRACKNFISQN